MLENCMSTVVKLRTMELGYLHSLHKTVQSVICRSGTISHARTLYMTWPVLPSHYEDRQIIKLQLLFDDRICL
jgi:hypothetical protein